jgi:hypothetical protein
MKVRTVGDNSKGEIVHHKTGKRKTSPKKGHHHLPAAPPYLWWIRGRYLLWKGLAECPCGQKKVGKGASTCEGGEGLRGHQGGGNNALGLPIFVT